MRDGVFPTDWRQIQAMAVCFLLRAMDRHRNVRFGEERQSETCKRLMEIPGVGPLIATAAAATMGDASAFKSGREFAAYVGLVPKQTGSGGKVRLLGISKRGDTYLRTLFIHGARAAALLAKEPSPWITELKKRRPISVAIVAMANKLARTVWAIAAHDRKYDKNHVSIRPY